MYVVLTNFLNQSEEIPHMLIWRPILQWEKISLLI
uniref:Uncharacterized protein n=1 Tax=Medicago truncatula TaxID=3880 RepID=I3T2E3_MEDTR|nr:unknown [Medicago truncatula]